IEGRRIREASDLAGGRPPALRRRISRDRGSVPLTPARLTPTSSRGKCSNASAAHSPLSCCRTASNSTEPLRSFFRPSVRATPPDGRGAHRLALFGRGIEPVVGDPLGHVGDFLRSEQRRLTAELQTIQI